MKLCYENGLTRARLLMEFPLMLCKTLPNFFIFFCFVKPSLADMVLSNGPWSLHSSLFIFQIWSRYFTISNENKLRVLVWVEFLGVPLPCWSFIESISNSLGKVITKKYENKFNAHPQKRICVEVDLSKDLKDSMEIKIGFQAFSQKMLYLSLPNTCYRCHSA